jgi:outer membrane protein
MRRVRGNPHILVLALGAGVCMLTAWPGFSLAGQGEQPGGDAVEVELPGATASGTPSQLAAAALQAETGVDSAIDPATGEHPVYHLRPEPFSDAAARAITLDELLELAAANNFGLQRQNLSVEKGHYSVDQTYFVFDPSLAGSLSFNKRNLGASGSESLSSVGSSESVAAEASATVPRPYGDSFRFNYSLDRSDSSLPGSTAASPASYSAGFGINYARPLGRGAGKFVNLIPRYTASNNLQLAYDKLDDDVRRLKKSVMDAYFQAVAAREAISVRENSLELALKQLERAVERFKVGLAIQADVNQAEHSVLSQRTELLNARQNFASLLDTLTTLVGLPQEFSLTVDASGALITLDDNLPEGMWDLVLANSYDLKSLNTQLANLRLAREQQLNQLKPDYALGLSYTRNGTDSSLGRAISGYESENMGVTLNWSATPGERSQHADVAQTELDLASTELSIQDAELQLKASLRGLQRDLTTKYQQIGLAESNLEVVRQTYDIMNERYNVGLGIMLDVVEAQENVLAAELALLNARVSYQQSYRELMLMAGLL